MCKSLLVCVLWTGRSLWTIEGLCVHNYWPLSWCLAPVQFLNVSFLDLTRFFSFCQSHPTECVKCERAWSRGSQQTQISVKLFSLHVRATTDCDRLYNSGCFFIPSPLQIGFEILRLGGFLRIFTKPFIWPERLFSVVYCIAVCVWVCKHTHMCLWVCVCVCVCVFCARHFGPTPHQVKQIRLKRLADVAASLSFSVAVVLRITKQNHAQLRTHNVRLCWTFKLCHLGPDYIIWRLVFFFFYSTPSF